MSQTNLRELLTAAIDGELSPAERKTAQRLLKESEPARKLFAQLKADASRIKNLPRVPAPADLADNILVAIRDRSMLPTPLPPTRHAGRRFNWSALPVWVNFASAACILLMVSVGSYLYFASSHDYYADREKQRNYAKNQLPVNSAESNAISNAVVKSSDSKTPAPPELLVQAPREVIEKGPNPRLVVADINVAPVLDPLPEIEPFDINKIRVSQFFKLNELADEATRKKLAAEMGRDELIRLDLFCETTPKSLELVLAALKARGITTMTDAFVTDRLKRKVPMEVMIFTEALTADEVAQIMAALGVEDQKSGAGEFSTLVAAPFLPADLDKLSKLLGIPNVLPKPVKGKQGVDIRKPLPEGTASQVAASLSKMGTTSPAPKPEKAAVVVAYSPMNGNPAASKEIKQFVDRRGERAANAKPLMLVLRTTK